MISINYATDPSCTALQWLEAAQTSSKTQPFVYSQCQAVHCRSLLPIQDTPSVKFTYEAKVSVDESLTALMSAENVGNSVNSHREKVFYFKQNVSLMKR